MAFAKAGDKGFKTKRPYTAGYGMLMELRKPLPSEFDSKTLGEPDAKGLVLSGKVVSILGAKDAALVPKIGSTTSVTIRPNDLCSKIFEDLKQTKESTRFLLEGITGETSVGALEARWAHGAGGNREIQALEIVGVPHVSFENPLPEDGPKSGWLRLNLDGSPTTFDQRSQEGEWNERELPFDVVVSRLKECLAKGGKFRVSQRVLIPSKATAIDGQDELEHMLKSYREEGFTSCMVRSFIPGTTDPRQVDVQLLNWPLDIEEGETTAAKTYDIPELRETKRFAKLRDGEEHAEMEIIPGYEMNLVGNPTDATKSVKHKFVQDIVGKGLSDGQKSLYASQSYGPGISIRAVNDDGRVLGLTRPATRTEGTQYRNLMSIPTHNFVDADKINFTALDKVTEVSEAE